MIDTYLIIMVTLLAITVFFIMMVMFWPVIKAIVRLLWELLDDW